MFIRRMNRARFSMINSDLRERSKANATHNQIADFGDLHIAFIESVKWSMVSIIGQPFLARVLIVSR